jgi:subtilase family serine protease
MGRDAIVVFLAALAFLTVALASADGADTAMLAGNHPPEAETLPSAGNADPAQPLEMEIRFALRNQAELDKLLAKQQTPGSPNYHKWLAAGEFRQRFGPRQADLDAVADWLRSEGFIVESTSDGYIKFAGSVAQVQRSLSVRIARFGDGSVYANVNDPMIPARFAGVIGSILGLDNMTRAVPAAPMMRIKPRAPSSSNDGKSSRSRGLGLNAFVMGEGVSFGPGDIRTFYDETISSGQEGAGGCIAIVGISDFLDDALAAFQAQFMPTEAVFNVTRVLHGKNPGRAGDNTEIEAELDLEWSHAVAPGAEQKFHFSTNGSFIDDITGAVNDSCDVVSISFSFCGPPSGYASTVDALMKKAAAFGESVFVSTGDFGAAGNPTKN